MAREGRHWRPCNSCGIMLRSVRSRRQDRRAQDETVGEGLRPKARSELRRRDMLRLLGFTESGGAIVRSEKKGESPFLASYFLVETPFSDEEKVTRNKALVLIHEISVQGQQGPYKTFSQVKNVLRAIAAKKFETKIGQAVDQAVEEVEREAILE